MSATDATFKAAIPGSSMAYPPGSFPHTKPPKYVDPNEFLEYLWKLLHQKDNLKMLWTILEQGGTVWAIARAILYKAAVSGIIQMNLAIVVYRTVFQMIDTIGQSKGIKTKHYPKFRSKTKDLMMQNKFQDMLKAARLSKSVQAVQQAPQVQQAGLDNDKIGLLNQLQQQGNQ